MQEESEFLKKWMDELFILGNHHAYGMCKDTYEDFGNRLLSESKEFLQTHSNISDETKMKIKCWQFWLIGFLSGQNLTIYSQNQVKI